MWEILENEVFLLEGSETILSMDSPEAGQTDGPDQLLVLIESLDRQAESFEAEIELDGELEATEGFRAAQAFFGTTRGSSGVFVRLRARVAGLFRITIARLKKHLQKTWEDMPCELCKKLAKLIARSILAWFGIGMPTDLGNIAKSISEFSLSQLLNDVVKSALWRWIEKSGLEVLALALIGPLALFLRGVRSVEEFIYVEACTAVGACGGK